MEDVIITFDGFVQFPLKKYEPEKKPTEKHQFVVNIPSGTTSKGRHIIAQTGSTIDRTNKYVRNKLSRIYYHNKKNKLSVPIV